MSLQEVFCGRAPAQEEPVQLEIKGCVPEWLSGVLYRVGPGKDELTREAGQDPVKIPHWFDGVGVAHRFEISKDGQVFYRNQNIAPSYEKRLREQGNSNGMVLFSAMDPCQSIFRRFINTFQPLVQASENINVNVGLAFPSIPASRDVQGRVQEWRDGVVLSTDASTLLEIDAESLAPLQLFQYVDINPRLKGLLSSAHHHQDVKTGAYYNFVLELGPRPCYRFFVLDGGERRTGQILAEIYTTPSYIHSFGMTENYLIFVQPPLYFALHGLDIKAKGGLVEAMRWEPTSPTKVFVIDRHGTRGLVKTYELPAFVFFHQVHCWEEQCSNSDGTSGTDLFMRLPTYYDHRVIHRYYLHGMGHPSCLADDPTVMPRLRLIKLANVADPVAGVATITDDRFPIPMEMPRINYWASQQRADAIHYAYGLGFKNDQPAAWMNRIIKLDYLNDQLLEWHQEGCYPGEPIFVARPGATAEDDGVLLSVVLDQPSDTSFLLILDAATLQETSRATYAGRIAMSLHGQFAQQA